MCGIAGLIRNNATTKEQSADLLDRMCRAIAHRGPDEHGTLVREQVALGARRLAIIDVRGGQQPIFSCDRTAAIVFNGEIYNFQELKKDLERRGHHFQTDSDTETIVHLYEEFGEKCVEHLRGMFAFAIYDFRRKKLFLARDRAGKKPLFYSLAPDGTFVFGSEIKALLATGKIERRLNFAALDAYLTFGYVPEELCIFADIKKLPPAHTLVFQNGKIEIKKYWDFPLDDAETISDEREIVEELNRLLAEAVKIRLAAEVPLGAFLSGGVDSSAVVGLMSQFSSQPVKTFSVGFAEDDYDELKFARLAAGHFQTEHHEFIVTPAVVNETENLVWHFDEPFADMSALPMFFLAKAARESVTVALSGDGGDELFAGYARYRRHFQTKTLPGVLRKNILQPVAAALPQRARGKNYLHNLALQNLERYVDSISHFNRSARRALYAPDFAANLDGAFSAGENIFHQIGEKFSENSLEQLLYLDSKTYLPADILTKVDRMTMAVSLEARGPLLDHKLIEFAARIPAALKMKNFETKHIFKRAVAGFVPPEILRRPKQGFGVPVDVWIKQELSGEIESVLCDARTRTRGFFESDFVANLLKEHRARRRDHAWRLWALFVLELWLRRYVDGK